MEPVFKDLCVDVADAEVSVPFYAALLGLSPDPERPVRLTGTTPEQTVWLNVVPEARTVKNRAHLDVHAGSLAEVLDLGATVLDDRFRWTVVAAPDGGEVCVFERAEPPAYRLYELVIDTADAPGAMERIAGWWADRLGATLHTEDGECWIEDGPGMPFPWVWEPVPEPKTAKNRVHWDVWGTPAEFIAAGATLVRARDAEIGWDVLADPDGNEFCVFAR